MGWLGWAFAAFLVMGLANIGMKGAALRGLSPAAVLLGVVIGETPLALAEWARRGRPARVWGRPCAAASHIFYPDISPGQGPQAGLLQAAP